MKLIYTGKIIKHYIDGELNLRPEKCPADGIEIDDWKARQLLKDFPEDFKLVEKETKLDEVKEDVQGKPKPVRKPRAKKGGS